MRVLISAFRYKKKILGSLTFFLFVGMIKKGDFFMSKSKKIILSAFLLALLIVLSRFASIQTQLLVISTSFIPIMMSAIWLGPKYSTLIAALGDLIGAILFPFGTYFPGFTLSAAISGWIYGIFLYQNPVGGDDHIAPIKWKFILKLTISSVLVLGIVNIFITSMWLHILYEKAYLAIIATRILAQVIMLPIQIITIYLLEKFTRPFVKKYLMED